MNSIRPLFTIVVLLCVGGYLYVKINEGPTKPAPVPQVAAPEGVPPLAAAAGGATLAQDTSAPAWPPAATPAGAAPAAVAPAATTASAAANGSTSDNDAKHAMPEVPPIPELPELPKTDAAPLAQAAAAATNTSTSTDSLGSRYDAGPQPGSGAGSATSGTFPPIPALPGAGGESAPSPTNTSAAGAVTPITPSFDAAADGTPGGSAADPSPASNSLRLSPIAPPAAQTAVPPAPSQPTKAASSTPDRYGLNNSAPADQSTAPLATTPMEPVSETNRSDSESFAASWPAIETALNHRDLKQAHQLLSKWHGNAALSPDEAQKVESLLGELAGTVIYSTEHQLEPARMVKAGETLESVAKEYNVPWQLLAKINGIPSADQVRPGQELKVVRGPFSAVVDLRRKELVLEVDGRYAGTFPISVPSAAITEGQWLVDQKLTGSPAGAAAAAYSSASSPDRSIVLRNAAGGAIAGPTLTIAGGPPAPGANTTAIQVAPQDAEDLSDILSIGSRVIVRR